MEKMEQELKVLEEQKVDKGLIEAVAEFRAEHKVDERVKNRIIKPDMAFFGKEVLEMGIATLLKGENLLLTGPKDRKSTRLNSSHTQKSRMPSSA